jgi:hypothetical protein
LALDRADIDEPRKIFRRWKRHHRGETHLLRDLAVDRLATNSRGPELSGLAPCDDEIGAEQPLRLIIDRAIEIGAERADGHERRDSEHHGK